MITVQEILDTVEPDTPDPDAVGLLIARATATLGREIGYYLGPPKVIAEIFRNPSNVLWLENEPVAGSVVTLERSSGPSDPWTEVPITAWVLEGRRLEMAVGYWGRAYRVTYTAGYDPEASPAPPQELAALVRAMVLGTLEAGAVIEAGTVSVMKSETMGDYSYDRGDGASVVASLGESWTETIRTWRRQRL